MKKTKLLFIAGAVLCASISAPFLNQTATASACKDVEFIFARGSGSGFNGRNETAWRNGLKEQLKSTTLTYDFYELGRGTYDGASYPAYAVGVENWRNVFTAFTALFTALDIGRFNDSVNQGVTEAVGRVNAVSSSCPGTKFVLGGYSQGAIVVDRAAKKIDSKKIAYVATFGDPNLYLPEGYGVNPAACRGEKLSRYRIFAPDCRAHAGLLGINKPYEASGLEGRVGLWCTKKDIFCSDTINLKDPIGDHLAYRDNGLYYSAAKTIVKKVLKLFPSKKPITSLKPSARRDTAILIDTTGSMGEVIDQYRIEALRLAAETLAGGGRVALFEYRDLSDPFNTRKVVDFGCTYTEFKAALYSLTTGGGADWPESALSGALYVMDNLDWRPGATKSLVILTDAPYLDPDRDGTTLDMVTRRSLEIDPVNIYIIVSDESVDSYRELAAGTSGQVFALSDDLSLSTDYLLARPEVNFALDEYSGKPGETFTFIAETEDENLVYDWDLDLDGKFETLNAGPTVTKTYSSEISGFVQVRVTNSDGLSSTASAKVTVSNYVEPDPEILTLSRISENVVNFTTTTNTFATLVVADGVPLGITKENNITITDSLSDMTLSLIPLTSSGKKGPAKSINFSTSGGKGDATTANSSASGGKGDATTANLPASSIKAPKAGVR